MLEGEFEVCDGKWKESIEKKLSTQKESAEDWNGQCKGGGYKRDVALINLTRVESHFWTIIIVLYALPFLLIENMKLPCFLG